MNINAIRLQNIDWIIDKHCRGVRSELARRLGREPTSIGRWWTKSKHGKKVSDRSARLIEETFSLPTDWLDNRHSGNDLEADPQKRALLKAENGESHVVPIQGSAILDQQYQLTIINNNKGKLMLLSTDGDAYAFQLMGHNPHLLLSKGWGLAVEPNSPLVEEEYALIKLGNGEILLRVVAYQDDEKLVVRHPISGEQDTLSKSQIERAEYCYIGIPPSKIITASKS